jgi:hypothetical protein
MGLARQASKAHEVGILARNRDSQSRTNVKEFSSLNCDERSMLFLIGPPHVALRQQFLSKTGLSRGCHENVIACLLQSWGRLQRLF